MTASNPQRLEQTISAIAALDLTPIKFKATRQEDGYGWTPEHADRMELAYKRYLTLHAKYPELTLAPDHDVDRFWHLHILDTRKYAADCDAVFGYFLHHYPYLGLRGEEDAKALQSAFAMTQALYVREFGVDRRGEAAWCGAEGGAQAAWCGADGPQVDAAWCGAEGSRGAPHGVGPMGPGCRRRGAGPMGLRPTRPGAGRTRGCEEPRRGTGGASTGLYGSASQLQRGRARRRGGGTSTGIGEQGRFDRRTELKPHSCTERL